MPEIGPAQITAVVLALVLIALVLIAVGLIAVGLSYGKGPWRRKRGRGGRVDEKPPREHRQFMRPGGSAASSNSDAVADDDV